MQQLPVVLDDKDLQEITDTELTDKFLEEHVKSGTFSNYSERALQQVCDDFVAAFLCEGEWIASLNRSLHECDSVLGSVEGTLRQFITRIQRIQDDIGEVYEKSRSTSLALKNMRAAESVVTAAVSHVVIPREVVQFIIHADDKQLGNQFTSALKKLYSFLKLNTKILLPSEDAAQASPRPLSEDGVQLASPPAATPTPQYFSLETCSLYKEFFGVLRNLTAAACVHVKRFLSRKLLVLSKTNTNIAMQQEHALLPYAFFVQFLKNAPHFLRQGFLRVERNQAHHAHRMRMSKGSPSVDGGSRSPSHQRSLEGTPSPRRRSVERPELMATPPSSGRVGQRTSIVPADELADAKTDRETTRRIIDITRVLYQEIKSQYIIAMSAAYKQKLERYLFVCNSLEMHADRSPGQTALQRTHFMLPLLVEPRTLPPSAFRLGARARVLEDMLLPPLSPAMEESQQSRHNYEETYRSFNRMLCDAVTHEYLFTFSFFSGDMTVHATVFRETMKIVEEYVADVMLRNSGNSDIVRRMTAMYSTARPNAWCSNDCYGLLILIRITHEFRTMMRDTRQLNCLESFYDSILMQLWPRFNRVFDEQLKALKDVNIANQLSAMEPLGSVDRQIAYIHPISKRYADFSSVLLGIAYSAVAQKAPDAVGSRRSASQTSGAPASPRGHTDLEHSTHSVSSNQISLDGRVSGVSSPTGKENRRASAEQLAPSQQPVLDLRQRALQALDAEVDCDAASHASRFSVLYSNLSFMRLEVQRFLTRIGTEIIPASSRRQLKHLTLAFELNNLFHILQVWIEAPVFGEEDQEHPLCETDDFKAIQAALETTRRKFVEALLDFSFPRVVEEINKTTEPVLADVISVGELFVANWKSGLDFIRELVMRVICDPLNHKDILAQLFVELLLYNTRLHARIGSALDANPTQRSVRTLVVTNAQLQQHMRTFATVERDVYPDS